MADYDRRPRGGRPQFNNRKRRYRDDDEFDHRPQRRRYEEPIAVTLRKQVLSIAESPVRKAEEDVANIAKTLAENYFDSDLTGGFLDLVLQMTVEQPLKIPFIAAIVLLCNAQKPDFTTEILSKVGTTAQKHLDSGEWREVKLFLRFMACLQGLFEGDGVFTILEELFTRAVELQTQSSEDSLGLELVKIILCTIPYTMASSAVGFEAQADSLMDKTDIIASTPHTLESFVDPFIVSNAGENTGTQSALAMLQKHMQDEAKSSWELACLPRPWKVIRGEEEEDPLLGAQKHPLPALVVPQQVQTGPRPIFPEMYFSVYAEQDIETVPPASDTCAILLRDALIDTINILDYNRSVSARFLIDVDCYFAPNTFVKRATPFDKLRDLPSDRPTWKPEDVAVDAVFSQLFQLPVPEQKLVYYHSVLTEACKIAPAAIAPSLGRAIRYLYRNVEKLDVELAERFLDWFAHHLSNFGFTWKWTEWVDDIELPNVHPRKAFIMAALDKEIRLSFAQRIKGTLPEPYQPLVSTEKERDTPEFKFNDEGTPFSSEGKELAAMIRRKAPETEIAPVMQSIEQQAAASGIPDPMLASTDVLVTAVCFVGSKSLSHVLSCIERCKDRLLAIGPASGSAQRHIITSVMDYWKHQAGVGINIVDKLLNYQILTPASVVEWALVEHVDGGIALSKAWVYEMVSSTLGKVTGRVRQVVAALRRPGLLEDQKNLLQETLEREMADTKALFSMVEDALQPFRDGSQDQMMEADGQADVESALIQAWGTRWIRVFQRKQAVEENWMKEELAKPIPEPEPVEDVKMEVKEEAGVPVNGTNGVEHDMDAIE